jgi:hypothetical protein
MTRNAQFRAELANDLRKGHTLSPKYEPVDTGHKPSGFKQKLKNIVGGKNQNIFIVLCLFNTWLISSSDFPVCQLLFNRFVN